MSSYFARVLQQMQATWPTAVPVPAAVDWTTLVYELIEIGTVDTEGITFTLTGGVVTAV